MKSSGTVTSPSTRREELGVVRPPRLEAPVALSLGGREVVAHLTEGHDGDVGRPDERLRVPRSVDHDRQVALARQRRVVAVVLRQGRGRRSLGAVEDEPEEPVRLLGVVAEGPGDRSDVLGDRQPAHDSDAPETGLHTRALPELRDLVVELGGLLDPLELLLGLLVREPCVRCAGDHACVGTCSSRGPCVGL